MTQVGRPVETEEERIFRLARLCESLYLNQPMPDDVFHRLLDRMTWLPATDEECMAAWLAVEYPVAPLPPHEVNKKEKE